uniref:Uncharacterized protein n=1 Tax=Arundo donax TaxID=35708 RepID=A0A0A9BEZ7_ARUDO
MKRLTVMSFCIPIFFGGDLALPSSAA